MLDDRMPAYLFDISETATFARLDCILDSVEFSVTINIIRINRVKYVWNRGCMHRTTVSQLS